MPSTTLHEVRYHGRLLKHR